MRTSAIEVYQRLYSAFGPQHWWPGQSPFEIMVGAVLVQNTAWRNVERAIENLRTADALEPMRLAAMPSGDIEELIRPAGYFRIKTRRLTNLVRFIVDRYAGSIEAMAAVDHRQLRDELLAINGIGPETADSILLYALDKPVMVVDAYAHRIWARHGWIDYDAGYYELQDQLAGELPDDAAVLNEMHALVVHTGHHFCQRTPKCDACPLQALLPPSGVIEPF